MGGLLDTRGLQTYFANQVGYANDRFGPFTSAHEGFGVLAEEVAELLDAIRHNAASSIQEEAIQVAAVAYRIATSMNNGASKRRSGCD